MPEPANPARNTRPRWLRTPSAWLIVPAAILLGLLLFALVWLSQRPAPEEDGAALLPAVTVESAAQSTLPAPQPPDPATDASAENDEGGVFVLPDAPADPPRAVAGEPPVPAGSGPDAGDPDVEPTAETAIIDSQPVPVRQPQPSYPRRALRQGLSGEVLVRAVVGTDGRPRQVEVARSSSHRVLDQAAVQAVRRWRFQPAMRHGQPVAQTVHVPINFNP